MFKKSVVVLVLIFCMINLTGCSWLAVNLTPNPVVDAVARGGAVARIAEQSPPTNPDELKEYLRANRELWEELEKWFELK